MRQCVLAGDQTGLSIIPLAEGAEPIWSLDVQEDVTCCWAADSGAMDVTALAASTRGLLVATPLSEPMTHKSVRIANASFTDVAPWGSNFFVSGSTGVSMYSPQLQCIEEIWSHRPCLQIASQYDTQLVVGNVEGNLVLRKMDGTEETLAVDIRTRALRFSSILPVIGYGQSYGQVSVWDCASGQTVYNKSLFSTSTTAVCFSHHSDKLMVSSCIEKMVFVDFRGSTIIKDMEVSQKAGITALDYSSDGYTIACGCRDGSLLWIDLRKYKDELHKEIRGPQRSCRVNRVVVARKPGKVESAGYEHAVTPGMTEVDSLSTPSVSSASRHQTTAQLSSMMSRLSSRKPDVEINPAALKERRLIETRISPKADSILGRPICTDDRPAAETSGEGRSVARAGAVNGATKSGATGTSANGRSTDRATNSTHSAPRSAAPVYNATNSTHSAPRSAAPINGAGSPRINGEAEHNLDIARLVQNAVESAMVDVRRDVQTLGLEMITQFHRQTMEFEDLVKGLRQEIQELRTDNAELKGRIF